MGRTAHGKLNDATALGACDNGQVHSLLLRLFGGP